MRKSGRWITLAIACVAAPTESLGGDLYWTIFANTATGGVDRADVDTLVVEPIVPTGLTQPYRIAVDEAGGKAYWTTFNRRSVQRANLDGTNIETIATTGSAALGIAVDHAYGKLYYSSFAGLFRSNLDGSGAQLVLSSHNIIQDVAIDPVHEFVYVSDSPGTSQPAGQIRRIRLDGTQPADLISGITFGPVGVAVDPAGGVYWGRFDPRAATNGSLDSAALDGGGVRTVVPNVDVDSLALDLSGRRLYWSDYNFSGATPMHRSNLDGTGVEALPMGPYPVGGITIVPEPSGVLIILIGFAASKLGRFATRQHPANRS